MERPDWLDEIVARYGLIRSFALIGPVVGHPVTLPGTGPGTTSAIAQMAHEDPSECFCNRNRLVEPFRRAGLAWNNRVALYGTTAP
jgi:hypothetical protein